MCKRHPRYKAIRKPTADCLQCWAEYACKHPEAEYTNKDMAKIIFAANRAITDVSDGVQARIDSHIKSDRAHGFIDPCLGEACY